MVRNEEAVTRGGSSSTPDPTSSSKPAGRRSAVMVGLLAVVLVVGSVISAILHVGLPGEETAAEHIITLAAFLLFALTGLVLVWRQPRNAIGWILFGSAACPACLPGSQPTVSTSCWRPARSTPSVCSGCGATAGTSGCCCRWPWSSCHCCFPTDGCPPAAGGHGRRSRPSPWSAWSLSAWSHRP